MLFILFRLGSERYALSIQHIVEILPVVEWKTIPYSTKGILGVFNYHDQIVPLLDLSEFVAGQPSRLLMSTRIMLVSYSEAGIDSETSEDSTEKRLLGLMAEEVTRTFTASLDDFKELGVEVEEASYLGPVISDSLGIIQLVEVQKLLPEDVREQLFLSIKS